MPAVDIESVLTRTAGIEGWLTDAQARVLHERAATLGGGTRIVEIGSFRGRSTIVLAMSAAEAVEVIAIDPHAGGDRGPREIAPDADRGESDHRAFRANLASAGVASRVRHVRAESDGAHDAVTGDIDLLFVDGAHRPGPARRDITGWGNRVSGGGTMLVHDAFSSVGVTLALLSSVVFGSSWRYQGRIGSLAEYRRERLTPRTRILNSFVQMLQLPWFVRNLAVKVLLVLRLGPLTRILGHRGGDFPY